MLYIPEVLQLPVPEYDFVCVDEAQDYSPVALNFTMRLVNPEHGGRLLFVGDPRQSIFGFAGADTDALDRIVTRANATVLPLSISYRCPEATSSSRGDRARDGGATRRAGRQHLLDSRRGTPQMGSGRRPDPLPPERPAHRHLPPARPRRQARLRARPRARGPTHEHEPLRPS
jgi:hypothetical protein